MTKRSTGLTRQRDAIDDAQEVERALAGIREIENKFDAEVAGIILWGSRWIRMYLIGGMAVMVAAVWIFTGGAETRQVGLALVILASISVAVHLLTSLCVKAWLAWRIRRRVAR